ncbi:MAG: hypothetical protein K0Q73_5300 [Paenibacillus sp.]|jgi:hypothetical protein|nr:hypothetical protein [Paenibacillus sp.]MDF2787923.1 hypothetical protein [Neobacillus sp.]
MDDSPFWSSLSFLILYNKLYFINVLTIISIIFMHHSELRKKNQQVHSFNAKGYPQGQPCRKGLNNNLSSSKIAS